MAVTYAPQQKSLADQVIPLLMQFQMQTKLQDREMAHRKDLKETMGAEALARVNIEQQKVNDQNRKTLAFTKHSQATMNHLNAETDLLKQKAQWQQTPGGSAMYQMNMFEEGFGDTMDSLRAALKMPGADLYPEKFKRDTETLQQLESIQAGYLQTSLKYGQMAQDKANNFLTMQNINRGVAATKGAFGSMSGIDKAEESSRLNTYRQLEAVVGRNEWTPELDSLLDSVTRTSAFPINDKGQVGTYKVPYEKGVTPWTANRGKEPLNSMTNKQMAAYLQKNPKVLENPRARLIISMDLLNRGMEEHIPGEETPEEWLIKNPNDPRAPEVRAGLNRRR